MTNVNNETEFSKLTNEGKDETKIPKIIDKIGKEENSPKGNLKNLYQKIGTRVSKIREVNENYEKRIKEQDLEINDLDRKIKEKEELLEKIRFHKSNLARGPVSVQAKISTMVPNGPPPRTENIVTQKESEDFFADLYNQLLEKGDLKMKINSNHILNDPNLRKITIEKEKELGENQNKLNSIIKKTEAVKKEIDTLRLENYKNSTNLNELLAKKKHQTEEMDKISQEANKYLQEKGKVNEELLQLNEKIDNQKATYESRMKELNKMIENTKRMKEYYEDRALEKFSKTTTTNFRKSMLISQLGQKKTTVNIIEEEENLLKSLNKELKEKKQTVAYLNLTRLILLKKQNHLSSIIKEVKSQTGDQDLEKLSEYLELSTKTNELFENDLKNLSHQKKQIEDKINEVKIEIQNTQAKVNDTSSKKRDYIESLKKELESEEKLKESYNKRLYTLNRVIDIITQGFKDICIKLNFKEELHNSNLDSNELILTKCMDLLERKILEIVQLNQDPVKDNSDALLEIEENKNKLNLIEKVMENMFLEEGTKKVYENKGISSVSLQEIKATANDLVNNRLDNYNKLNLS